MDSRFLKHKNHIPTDGRFLTLSSNSEWRVNVDLPLSLYNIQGCSIEGVPSPLIEHEVGSPIVIPWEDEEEEECDNVLGGELTDDIVFSCAKQDDTQEKTLKCIHCSYITEHRSYLQRHMKVMQISLPLINVIAY